MTFNPKGSSVDPIPTTSAANVAALAQAMKQLGVTVKSDHLFVPQISVGGIDANLLPLHFHRVEVPAVLGVKQECKVAIRGTRGLGSRAIADAMKRCEQFSATVFLGMPSAHQGSIELKCRFVRVNPVELAWEDLGKVADIEVVLEVEAISFAAGNIEKDAL